MKQGTGFQQRSGSSVAIRRIGRRLLQLTGTKSFVRADGFWWYRWHPDAGIGSSTHWEELIKNEVLRPGACFVDVGAHVGRWSIRSGLFYRRILAFEPDPFTNSVLRRNIARNDIHNIVVFQTALSNRRGRATLLKYGTFACNSLRSTHSSGQTPKSSKLVRVRPLDDYSDYFQSPMVIKIDVEGEELNVLDGAEATLKNYKPAIIVEIHFRNEVDGVTKKLEDQGYDALEIIQDNLNPGGQVYIVTKNQ